MRNKILGFFALLLALYSFITFQTGCAQIGAPTGGIKDSLAPVLVKASPDTFARNFRDNRITLSFNEYVEVQEIQNNVMVSPLQKTNPTITYNLRTVTIRLRDTLLPNTTYSINFGNAIKDVNEGNVFKNFTYVFSTGPVIDSLTFSGKVLLAETSEPDSTLSVLLYRNMDDSAVRKIKPDYLTRVNGDGTFSFNNLPPGRFNVYALKDGDGGKTYNSKTETFAFLDSSILSAENPVAVTLYAYAEEQQRQPAASSAIRNTIERRLRYSTNLSGTQDLLQPLVLTFNNRLKVLDTALLNFTDTNYNKIPNTTPVLDSTKKILSFTPAWTPGQSYLLVINKDAVQDSTGNKLAKNDTIRINTKTHADYGRVTLRFKNFNAAKNPVLQFFIGDAIKFSFPLTSAEWSNTRFLPGEYELRILYDDNKDGKWSPGDYDKKIQPEKAISLPQKLSIRADWDNERDIAL